MRHLFIINPEAGSISLADVLNEIHTFFYNYPTVEEYTIHVTRWKRDAVGYIRRFVGLSREMTRVYAVGGGGTLYEALNGIAGLPNAQTAFYPAGKENAILYSFGPDAVPLFSSLRNLVFSSTKSIDLQRVGENYCLQDCLLGAEAEVYQQGYRIAERFRLPRTLCYYSWAAGKLLTKKICRNYRINADGTDLSGDYISILVANFPTYSGNWWAAPEAVIDDGLIDCYFVKRIPPLYILQVMNDYLSGRGYKWPQYVSHTRCKKLSVSSDEYITISADGEIRYAREIEFEMLKKAMDFVVPPGVDIHYGESQQGGGSEKNSPPEGE
jgi:diacylglycerol kinase family enzyme